MLSSTHQPYSTLAPRDWPRHALLLCLLPVICCTAAEQKPRVMQPLLTNYDDAYRSIAITLQAEQTWQNAEGKQLSSFKNVPFKELLNMPMRAGIGIRGKQLTQFWYFPAKGAKSKPSHAYTPWVPQKRYLDVSGLSIDATTLKGTIAFPLRTEQPHKWIKKLSINLDITLDDGKATGTFTAKAIVSLEKSTMAVTANGTVQGTHHDDTQLQAEHAFDKSVHYSWSGGPNGNHTTDYDGKLISSAKDIRLLWVSEDNMACSYRAYNNYSGGYNPALVRQGKIYQYYFEPNGKAPFHSKDPSGGRYTFRTTRAEIDAWKSRGANDVVVCLDGATGRTLWRKSIPGGVNQAHMTKGGGGPLCTPVVTDDYMYIFGTKSIIYCLDIHKQGEIVWQQDFGKLQNKMRHWSLAISGDTLLVPGVYTIEGKSRTFYGAVGLDSRTGTVRWVGGPDTYGWMPWQHEGKDYFICGKGLFDAHSGEHLWKFRSAGHWLTVNGNRAYVLAGEPHRVEAYSITPSKATFLWGGPEHHNGDRPIAYKDWVVFAWRESLKKRAMVIADKDTGKILKEYGMKSFAVHCGTVAHGGLVVVQGYKESLMSIDPTKNVYIPLNVLGDSCILPTMIDGRLLCRGSNSFLYCFDVRQRD